jgi:hypothetical protein
LKRLEVVFGKQRGIIGTFKSLSKLEALKLVIPHYATEFIAITGFLSVIAPDTKLQSLHVEVCRPKQIRSLLGLGSLPNTIRRLTLLSTSKMVGIDMLLLELCPHLKQLEYMHINVGKGFAFEKLRVFKKLKHIHLHRYELNHAGGQLLGRNVPGLETIQIDTGAILLEGLLQVPFLRFIVDRKYIVVGSKANAIRDSPCVIEKAALHLLQKRFLILIIG